MPTNNEEPITPTDDVEVDPPPSPPELPADPEAPVADALEQATEVSGGWRMDRVSRGIEVPEADAIEQALVPPDFDEDE